MTSIELKRLTDSVIQVATTAALFIRQERSNFDQTKVEVKGLNDLVSYVDKTSEKMIVEGLALLLPDSGFIVEENTRSHQNDYNWIVDPLDGTTNFVHGVPCYAVSIALEHKGKIVLGVVLEVSRNECFSAYAGGGAYLNNNQIYVSKNSKLADSLIATGFPIYNFSRIEAYTNTLIYMMRNTHGVRRIGAAASDLCYLACGRVDAFFEYNLNAWDVAAGALIVKEAGGEVFDFSGGENWLFGKEIMATNGFLSSEFSEVIQTYF